jgi:hypothetical protein
VEEPAGTRVTELRQSVSAESPQKSPDLTQRKPISLMGFQKLNKDLGEELDPQANRGGKTAMKDPHRKKENVYAAP